MTDQMPDLSGSQPEMPPARSKPMQFSLATLLGIVLFSALVASALRGSGLDKKYQLVAFVVGGIFLSYLSWRWFAAWRSFARWNQVQQHREQLEHWARERSNQLHQREKSNDLPPQD